MIPSIMSQIDNSNFRGNPWLKFADRLVGIPIVFACGMLHRLIYIFSRSKIETVLEDFHKLDAPLIAVIKEAAIGDTVLLSAIIQDLLRFRPRAEVHLFAGQSNFEFAKGLSSFGNIQVLPFPTTKPWSILKTQNREYDMILDFGTWPRINAIFSFFLRAKLKVGFKTANQFRHFTYDFHFEHSSECHELMNYRSLLTRVGIPTGCEPFIPVSTQAKWSQSLALKTTASFAIFHLWPGGENCHLKEWSENNWTKLAKQLSPIVDQVCLTGAKSDFEKTEKFIQNFYSLESRENFRPDFLVNACGLSIDQTQSLIRSSKIVVSVNTGIMHLAAALQRPTIGLHGPTSAKRWGPWGKTGFAVISKHPQAEHLNLGFEHRANLDTMKDVQIQEVYQLSCSILKG